MAYRPWSLEVTADSNVLDPDPRLIADLPTRSSARRAIRYSRRSRIVRSDSDFR
jgi:hypothetical protein